MAQPSREMAVGGFLARGFSCPLRGGFFSKMILDFGKANRRPHVRCRERTNKNVRSNPRSVRHQGARAPDKHSTSLESARSSELPSQVRQPFLAGNNLRTLRFSRGKKQTLLFCFCQQKKHTEKKSRFWPFKKVCRTKQASPWLVTFFSFSPSSSSQVACPLTPQGRSVWTSGTQQQASPRLTTHSREDGLSVQPCVGRRGRRVCPHGD